MRNIFLISSLFLLGSAWAADPLVGPGKVGEKDEKGHVRGADSGAGPHRSFPGYAAPRVDTPVEAEIRAKKEKEAKAKKEAKEASGTGSTSQK
jgi:hypothetical protein